MPAATPAALIDTLVDARNRGDVGAAFACYATDATIVAQPGQVLRGGDGVRGVLDYFTSLTPTFEVSGRTILEAGDIALHHSQWTLRGTDAAGDAVEFTGASADVLHRKSDGSWLMAIDNPWGAGILGATE
ncbi:YybH family protein [Micromonospora sp. 067-2]|uniref:YybH family protein n=1 Tax=Micromonospora sp. 067-2 TaxID=2789270 RepID=UPI00397A163E